MRPPDLSLHPGRLPSLGHPGTDSEMAADTPTGGTLNTECRHPRPKSCPPLLDVVRCAQRVRLRNVSAASTSAPTANAATTSSGPYTSHPSSPAVTAPIASIA